MSRLIESRDLVGSTTYVQKPTFDAYGNITQLETGPQGGTTTLATTTSTATNRLTTSGTAYDPVGNMTIWNGGPQYDYDRLNRMRYFRGSSAPSAEEWVFAYTADDERILSQRVSGGGTIWSLRGLDRQILREWRAENGKHAFKDYVWSGRDLVAKVERTPAPGSPPWTESTTHVATNHLGSPWKLTDGNGVQVTAPIYYPFGQQINTLVDGERIKFTGHERDLWNTTSATDDLDYMHARHYNPQLARFLQIDPLAGSVRRPQSLNRYAYVAGNPLTFVDPLGLTMRQVPCPPEAPPGAICFEDDTGVTATDPARGCSPGAAVCVQGPLDDDDDTRRDPPIDREGPTERNPPLPPPQTPNSPELPTREPDCGGFVWGVSIAYSGPTRFDRDGSPFLSNESYSIAKLPDGWASYRGSYERSGTGNVFGISLNIFWGAGTGHFTGKANTWSFNSGPFAYGESRSGAGSRDGGWRTTEIGISRGAPFGAIKGETTTRLASPGKNNKGCIGKK